MLLYNWDCTWYGPSGLLHPPPFPQIIPWWKRHLKLPHPEPKYIRHLRASSASMDEFETSLLGKFGTLKTGSLRGVYFVNDLGRWFIAPWWTSFLDQKKKKKRQKSHWYGILCAIFPSLSLNLCLNLLRISHLKVLREIETHRQLFYCYITPVKQKQ